MRAPSTAVLTGLLALAGAAGGCTKPCDDDALHATTSALRERSDEGRRLGLLALWRACPAMPKGLRSRLELSYGDTDTALGAASNADRRTDKALTALLERTCPSTDAEHAAVAQASDRAAAMREACHLDRYGVLDADELFVVRDLDAFLLYEWLTSSRIDEVLARDVVRGLMIVSASAEERTALCYQDGDGCQALFAGAGIALARSTADVPLPDAVEVRVSPTAITVAGAPLVPLRAGLPEPDAFAHHIAEPLHDVLVAQALLGSVRARHEAVDWHHRLRLLGDASLPFGTIADVLFTARKAGYDEFGLVVGSAHGAPALITASPPLAWAEPDPDRAAGDAPLQLIFVVHPTDVQIRVADVDETLPFDTVAQRVAALKAKYPHETVATFRVDPDVPWQRLVTLIDTVRGADCDLRHAMLGESVPESCWFWQVIVDANPPLCASGC